jgi:hypothetical protein
MGTIEILTPAAVVDLTTRARAKAELGIAAGDVTHDATVDTLIAEASAAVLDYLDGSIAPRERVRERCSGAGRTTLILSRRPVAAIEAVTCEDDASVTAAEIEIRNRRAGIVWRELGFPNDQPVTSWLGTDPADWPPETSPQQGPRPWQFDYLAGDLLPGDAVEASGFTVAAAGTLTRAAGAWPLVASGEVVTCRGFTNAGNNGRFVVRARTDTVLTLSAVLAAETAPGGAIVHVRTLPVELERAVLDTIRAWYSPTRPAPNVTSERIGDWSASYATARPHVLPEAVLGVLDRWQGTA